MKNREQFSAPVLDLIYTTVIAIFFLLPFSQNSLDPSESIPLLVIAISSCLLIFKIKKKQLDLGDFHADLETISKKHKLIDKIATTLLILILATTSYMPIFMYFTTQGIANISSYIFPMIAVLMVLKFIGFFQLRTLLLMIFAPKDNPAHSCRKELFDFLTGYIFLKLPSIQSPLYIEIPPSFPFELTILNLATGEVYQYLPDTLTRAAILYYLSEKTGNPYSLAWKCAQTFSINPEDYSNHQKFQIIAETNKARQSMQTKLVHRSGTSSRTLSANPII